MGIKDRISTAKFLISHGFSNDALILILVAVAASSRKKYSTADIKSDGEAFKAFLNTGIKNILPSPFSEERFGGSNGIKLTFNPDSIPAKRVEHTIEDLIYKQYRCRFMHEGELPADVIFTGDLVPCREHVQVTRYDKTVATLSVTHDERLIMSHNWLDTLIMIVEQAEINSDLFGPAPVRETDDYNGPKILLWGMKAC